MESSSSSNLLEEGMQIDYHGGSVSVSLLENLLALDTESFRLKYGSHAPVLDSDSQSTVVLFLSGHGGDQFFKFHDVEEWDAVDFAAVLHRMYLQARYRHLIVILDTCQASTMADHLHHVPHITLLASSQRDENSFAYFTNDDIGLPVIDRYSYAAYHFLRNKLLPDKKENSPSSASRSPSHLHPPAMIRSPWTWRDLHSSLHPEFLQSRPFYFESDDTIDATTITTPQSTFNNHDRKTERKTESKREKLLIDAFLPADSSDSMKLQRIELPVDLTTTPMRRKSSDEWVASSLRHRLLSLLHQQADALLVTDELNSAWYVEDSNSGQCDGGDNFFSEEFLMTSSAATTSSPSSEAAITIPSIIHFATSRSDLSQQQMLVAVGWRCLWFGMMLVLMVWFKAKKWKPTVSPPS